MEGGQVGEMETERARKSRIFCWPGLLQRKFVSVDLLECARSDLSAHSVHVALLDVKFSESLAIPTGAGGDTPGREEVQAGHPCPLALKMLSGYHGD